MASDSRCAAVNAATNLLVGEYARPALDEIDPGCARRCEVQMEARSLQEPSLDGRRFVGAEIVEHEVDVVP
jgi:hypothetical protein